MQDAGCVFETVQGGSWWQQNIPMTDPWDDSIYNWNKYKYKPYIDSLGMVRWHENKKVLLFKVRYGKGPLIH